ncbi:hypothetical protein PENTCL1PPCAC_22956, partial [Pristionchus entomophagus]
KVMVRTYNAGRTFGRNHVRKPGKGANILRQGIPIINASRTESSKRMTEHYIEMEDQTVHRNTSEKPEKKINSVGSSFTVSRVSPEKLLRRWKGSCMDGWRTVTFSGRDALPSGVVDIMDIGVNHSIHTPKFNLISSNFNEYGSNMNSLQMITTSHRFVDEDTIWKNLPDERNEITMLASNLLRKDVAHSTRTEQSNSSQIPEDLTDDSIPESLPNMDFTFYDSNFDFNEYLQ